MNKKTSVPLHPAGIKSLPYGISDYGLIRRENYYYIDKTSFLPVLESAGRYLFFIRPRRFGKSLFLSMLEAYYDIIYKDHFEELFKGTAIYENPTRERNSYFVLSFDFSQVESASSKLENSFLLHVREQVRNFFKKYRETFGDESEALIQEIEEIDSAAGILSALSALCRESQRQTYVLIDEYDNFANTILSSSGTDAYHNLTHGEGFYRSFFNVLKGGTSRMEAPFNRILLTGVSPVTLDDVTSGYNIGENVSLDAAFNRMLGFSEAELAEILDYYSSKGKLPAGTGKILAILKEWYGNYLFSKYAPGQERIYNPDMVLYFLKEYFKNQSLPEDLIDYNVKIDYGKLRHLIIIDRDNSKKTNGNFSYLKEIIEKGSIWAKLVKSFPLKKITDTNHFVSLLFYFGLLTINDSELDTVELIIPNETIHRLYYSYIKEGYEESGVFSLDILKYRNLMKGMSLRGEWKPFFDFITGYMRNSMSLRDLMTGEKAVQAFLNVYLSLSDLYIIYPERESNKGYADIIMEPFLARYEGIKYSYMIEIKYIARGDAGKKPAEDEIKKLVSEAGNQLQQYSLDEKLVRSLGKTTLVKLILVFCGHDAVYIGEASAPRQ